MSGPRLGAAFGQARRALGGRFLRDGVWIMGAYGVTIISGLVSVRLFTELAMPSVFGGANLLLGVLTLGTQTLLAPITQTQLRYHSAHRDEGNADAYTWRIAKYAGSAAVLMIIVLAIVLLAWPAARAGAHIWVIPDLAAWTIASTYRSVLINRIQADRRQKYYSLWLGSEALSTMACTAVVLYFSPTIEGYIGGQALGVTLTALAYGRIPKRPPAAARQDLSVAGVQAQIRAYGLPFAPFALMGWLSNQSDRYVLAAYLSTAAVGQYAAAFGISSRLPQVAGGLLNDLFRPALFEAENRGDFARGKRLLMAWLVGLTATITVLIFALFLFGDHLADLLLAKAYRPGAKESMGWIATGYGFTVLAQVIENQIFAMGSSRTLLWTKLSGGVANVALAIAIVPAYGVLGAARANVVGQLFQLLATVWAARLLQAKRTVAASATTDAN